MAFLNKQKCRGCQRFYPPSELVTRLCGRCWDDKHSAIHQSVQELTSFSNGETYKCMECGKTLGPGASGHLVWVRDAQRHALFCLDCSDRKFLTDSQYRETPFGISRGA
jgi:DNA-directed RNA polymerase subunit RPC12/RpoP